MSHLDERQLKDGVAAWKRTESGQFDKVKGKMQSVGVVSTSIIGSFGLYGFAFGLRFNKKALHDTINFNCDVLACITKPVPQVQASLDYYPAQNIVMGTSVDVAKYQNPFSLYIKYTMPVAVNSIKNHSMNLTRVDVGARYDVIPNQINLASTFVYKTKDDRRSMEVKVAFQSLDIDAKFKVKDNGIVYGIGVAPLRQLNPISVSIELDIWS